MITVGSVARRHDHKTPPRPVGRRHLFVPVSAYPDPLIRENYQQGVIDRVKWTPEHAQITKIGLSDRCGGRTLPVTVGYG